MNDAVTRHPLRVSTDGSTGPYIMVPVSQLEEIRRVLDNHRLGYWIDENAISFDGSPEIAIVNLGRSADALAVQKILDSVD